ncbi:hypothetical protein G7085_06895 [Tessaracoccus sp. HDW20]|uniref:hypothetical protein n=1 Tax=Tessaracoccus coleopterorum TaxID=2714950 RepID=UPI0018D2D8C5|nr:hypothetical protein [Tessaracoccus coleopterorum]NHB84423.1 hypothetical protein [Tessaracoccus coleopterorum]
MLKALGTLSGHAAGGGEVPNSAIADALAVTGTQLALARRNGWGRLTAWLSEGVDRLAWLLPADGPVETRRLARAENDGFDALLDDLARPGSLPPRSTRQLGRTAEETLKRGADTYPALLARLRPELAPSLYGPLARCPLPLPGAEGVGAATRAAAVRAQRTPAGAVQRRRLHRLHRMGSAPR